MLARGSAVADYDNDGDLDIAISSIHGHAILLANEGEKGDWLTIEIDEFAPGTVAILTLPDGRELIREWHVGSSYLASEDPRFHFGVGSATVIPKIEIHFPDGRQTTLTDIAVNQFVTPR